MPKFLTFWGCFSCSCEKCVSNLLVPPRTWRARCFWAVFGLTNLLDADDLASGLLDLPQSTQEVPKPRFGDGLVRGKNGHAVHARAGVCLGGQVAPDDLVLVKTTCTVKSQPTDRNLALLAHEDESALSSKHNGSSILLCWGSPAC